MDSVDSGIGQPERAVKGREPQLRGGGLHGIPRWVYLAGTAIYLGVLGLILFRRGGFIGPDTILPVILLVVIVLGQLRTFLRDWVPFVLIFFGWQMLRGYADQAARGGGFPVHEADLVRWEQALFGGELPTLWLQDRLYDQGVVRWYDVMATGFWAFHFVLALAFAFLLWMRGRALYWRYVYGLLLLSFAGFFTYILFPAVPPWLASERGTIPEYVHHVQWEIMRELRFGSNASVIMANANPNNIAAMPSLHAAYPSLVLLFCLVYWRAAAPFAALYCAGLWFSIVYIGDHYVIDALAGVAYAAAAFFALEALYALLARKRQARESSSASAAEVA